MCWPCSDAVEGSAVLGGPCRGRAPRAAMGCSLYSVQRPEHSLASLFSVPRFVMGTLWDTVKARVLEETEKKPKQNQVQSDELLGYAGGNKC